MKSRLILSSLLSLLLGGCIYLFFRDPSIIFFGWIEKIGFLNEVILVQDQLISVKEALPNWVIYSLPDGLWLFSYVCLMLHVWRNSMRWAGVIWVLILPLLAITFEIIQSIDASFGTFDWLDLLMYFLATIIPFRVFKKNSTFKSHKILQQ